MWTKHLIVVGVLAAAAVATLPVARSQDQPAQPGMKGGMERMKASEPMMTRCRMMMNMEVKSDDPAALLALKEQLKLSEEQVNRLKAIVAQAREQAEKVLTDEQRKELEPLAQMPDTMQEMHRQMMARMQDRGKPGMMQRPMCPMMEMMQHMNQGAEEDQEHQHHD